MNIFICQCYINYQLCFQKISSIFIIINGFGLFFIHLFFTTLSSSVQHVKSGSAMAGLHLVKAGKQRELQSVLCGTNFIT